MALARTTLYVKQKQLQSIWLIAVLTPMFCSKWSNPRSGGGVHMGFPGHLDMIQNWIELKTFSGHLFVSWVYCFKYIWWIWPQKTVSPCSSVSPGWREFGKLDQEPCSSVSPGWHEFGKLDQEPCSSVSPGWHEFGKWDPKSFSVLNCNTWMVQVWWIKSRR